MIFRFLFCLFVCWGGWLEAKTAVLVSIAPQKFLVEKIGGNTVSVSVIVPPGFSSHSYEPSPRQLVTAKKGDIWFRIGESFEKKLLGALKNHLVVVDPIHLNGTDNHTWLNPLLLKTQAEQIARTLSAHNPDRAVFYHNNLSALLKELDLLDQEISEILAHKKHKFILVSHPAFHYFCQQYGLEQLSIEMEGKEPTPKYITDLLLNAEARQISYVYVQKQHGTKGGEWMARKLGAELVFLDPYAENVIENLKIIAKAFSLQ
ncbi:MAG: zinc ABC transporter substrate-binding protein [Chlamydiales bacterium]